LVVVPTIHPRGDQRILRCAQVALDAGYRVEFIWLGEGKASTDVAVAEQVLPPARSFLGRIRSLPTISRSARRRDVTLWHIHDLYLLPLAWWWHRRHHRPVIYDVHEYYSIYYSEMLPLPSPARRWVRRLIDSLQVRITRKIGGANVVAEPMADLYHSRDVPVSITPNLPLAAPYRQVEIQPFESRRHRVVHTGTTSEGYGMRILIDVAAECARRNSNISFDLIRRFPNHNSELAFREHLERRGDPDNLNLIDPVSPHHMPALLRDYGIGMSTILDRGQNDLAIPSKLYEYAMMGIVLVGTDRRAQAAFAKRWCTSFLFDDGDVRGMADAIATIADEPIVDDQRLLSQAVAARAELAWEGESSHNLTALLGRLTAPAATAGTLRHGARGSRS
jgi:glycosyltransferase involved in cell wall biosynthesis